MQSSEERFENFFDVLLARGRDAPTSAKRLVFLGDDQRVRSELSYAALLDAAARVARVLRGRLAPGDRAVLCYPPGLEFLAAFFGCLAADVVAVPAYAPIQSLSSERLLHILEDSGATAVLTDTLSEPDVEHLYRAVLRRESVLVTDAGDAGTSGDGERDLGWSCRSGRDDVAFLQYTSGSTRDPRGVMVTHGNLIDNVNVMQTVFHRCSEDVFVSWAPHYHDMGLVGMMLYPTWVGATVVMMSPFTFLRRPIAWLDAISRFRGTVSAAPNFAFDLCVRRTRMSERSHLDLSCWVTADVGNERASEETLRRFASAFEPYGFRWEAFAPAYGLAEATLFVSGGGRGSGPAVLRVSRESLREGRGVDSEDSSLTLVSCGAVDTQRVVVVDPATGEPLGENRVGEIWVQGASVAKGYWNRPRETAETFGGRLAGVESTFLRTGDLGFVRAGQLYYADRIKDLIVIRGANYYPTDIEWAVARSHPAIRPGSTAAFSVQRQTEEKLAIVVEARLGELEGDERAELCRGLAGAIRTAVGESLGLRAEVVAILAPGSVPRTSSGKIQRSRCRRLLLEGSLEPVWVEPEELDLSWFSAALEQRERGANPSLSGSR